MYGMINVIHPLVQYSSQEQTAEMVMEGTSVRSEA
jgi:hypothetical protein